MRHLDNAQSVPSSLEVIESSRTVLDWTLHALSSRGVSSITYVGGYHIQKVMRRCPTLNYRFHALWQEEGELAALLLAQPQQEVHCLVIRSRTLLLPQALDRVLSPEDGIVVGCYTSKTEQAFTGLIRLPHQRTEMAFDVAARIVRNKRDANLDEWLQTLRKEGIPFTEVNLDGLAAPSSDRAAVARTVFGSKGRALEQVRPLLKSAVVLDQIRFGVIEWQQNPQSVLDKISAAYENTQVVVRSSAHDEDGIAASSAGRFRSVLSVLASDQKQLWEAIDYVIDSYALSGRLTHEQDEVFVQRQVGDLAASGVLLTRDMETGAPYYVLNIDRQSGRSDVVTSGAAATVDSFYISRTVDFSKLAHDVRAAVALGRELQQLTHLHALNIEFGIDRAGTCYLFQVRPIAESTRKFELVDEDLDEELERVREFLIKRMRTHPHLHGTTTVLGTMPDWNPAEMIGTTPRPLALSLYQRLIGDRVWAEARARIGYFDVSSEPLIVSLGGRPYVDVRASLNSFLPSGLEPEVAEKWVEYCLARLSVDPRLHDKIEFDMAITCLTFDFDLHLQRLREAGLSSRDIAHVRARLLTLTDEVLQGAVAPIDKQLELIDQLGARRQRLLMGEDKGISGLAWCVHMLLADCERYGTTSFSILARYAFIAMALLRSLREVEVFSEAELEMLLRAIPTVASELSNDLAKHRAGALSTMAFLSRYGHLRPSSYDITSPNYALAPELYLTGQSAPLASQENRDSRAARDLFDSRTPVIDQLLRNNGFTCRTSHLRDFVLRSIPAREKAKFEFMKNVDATLEAIARLGEGLGFTRDDMSFLPVERVERGATDSPTGAVRGEFRRSIEFFKKRWNLTCAIRLPHLVRSPDDVDAFQLEEWTPNFVSTRRVIAEPVVLSDGVPAGTLDGKIVLIRAADPGYDWIFGHAISGLVTQYGGVASHMAIRAAEFGLPAAIGCGEMIFERLRAARLIELDCTNKKVRGLA